MLSINTDIRMLIIQSKEAGKSEKEISNWFNVGVRTISRFWTTYRHTGDLTPKVHSGKPSSLTEEHKNAIREKIKAQPDATLSTIVDDLDLPIQVPQLHKFLKKSGYTRKKKH